MDNLFGEVHLEVADYFSATLAPALHCRKRGVLEEFAAFIERIIERSIPPFVKDWFSHYQKSQINNLRYTMFNPPLTLNTCPVM